MRPTRSRRSTADSAQSDQSFKTAPSEIQEDVPKSSSILKSISRSSQIKNTGNTPSQNKANTTATKSTGPSLRTAARATRTPNAAVTSSRTTRTSKATSTVTKPTNEIATTNTAAASTKPRKAASTKRKRETIELEDNELLNTHKDRDENVQDSHLKVVKRKKTTSDSQTTTTTSKRKVERETEDGNPEDDSFWNIEKAFAPSTVRKPTITYGNKTRHRLLVSSTRKNLTSVDIFANLKPSLIVKPPIEKQEQPTTRRTSNQSTKGVKPVTEMVINGKAQSRTAASKKRSANKSSSTGTASKSKPHPSKATAGTSTLPKAAANTPTPSKADTSIPVSSPLTAAAETSSSITATGIIPRHEDNTNPAPASNKPFRDKGKGRAEDYNITSTPPITKKPLSLSKSKSKTMASDMSSNVGFGSAQIPFGDLNDSSFSSLKKQRFDLLVPSYQLGNQHSSFGLPLDSADMDMQDAFKRLSPPIAGNLLSQKPELSVVQELTAELSISNSEEDLPAVSDEPIASSTKAPSPPDKPILPIKCRTPPPPDNAAQKLKFLQSTPTASSSSREVSAFDIFGNCPLSPIHPPTNPVSQQFDILQSTPIFSGRRVQLINTEDFGSVQRLRRHSPPKSPVLSSRQIVDLGLDVDTTPTENQKNMRVDDYIMSLADQSIEKVKEHGQKQIDLLHQKSSQIKDGLIRQLFEQYGNNDGE